MRRKEIDRGPKDLERPGRKERRIKEIEEVLKMKKEEVTAKDISEGQRRLMKSREGAKL